jgi:hypothetical protein
MRMNQRIATIQAEPRIMSRAIGSTGRSEGKIRIALSRPAH